MDGGQGGDPDLVLLVVDCGGEPTVLGFAFFGDIQTADDLDTGQNGVLQAQIIACGGKEHTIDAEPDAGPVRSGFDVDIRGALADRLLHQRGHQHDHGGGTDVLAWCLLFRAAFAPAGLGIALGGLLHLVGSVVAVNGEENVTGLGQEGADAALACRRDEVAALHIHGIIYGNTQDAAILGIEGEGDHDVAAQQIGTNELTDLGRDGVFVKPDGGDAGDGGEGF